MAPSANRAAAVAAIPCLAASLALSACSVTTTQEKSARLSVKADRVTASNKDTKLGEPDPDVEIVSASIVRDSERAAIAVVLRNTGTDPVNDLPLGVGVQAQDGKREFLNLHRNTPYFQSHVPVVAPGEQTTFIYTSKDEVPEGELFAEAGAVPDPPPTVAGTLPAVDVGSVEPGEKGLDVEVTNNSDIPQYELEVYAYAGKPGAVLAAGTATVADLQGGDTTTVSVDLIGDPKDAEVQVLAPPTIFE